MENGCQRCPAEKVDSIPIVSMAKIRFFRIGGVGVFSPSAEISCCSRRWLVLLNEEAFP
jgi:hypothetical protein